MKAKLWVAGYIMLFVLALVFIGWKVYDIDPFFHYHKPDTEEYFYRLSNQRSMNDGISKHFDYNAMITGTSMTENFKTSEMDKIFGVKSIKVAYPGGSYKEINDNMRVALNHNPDLKMIVRSLDMSKFFSYSDSMRTDLGSYPTYLYDKNPFNDVQYLYNKSVIFSYIYPMIQARKQEGFMPGITSFDEYSNWQNSCTFGIHTVRPNGIIVSKPEKQKHLTQKQKKRIADNIQKNVTSLAKKYPDVTFYYFFTPYSAAWWNRINGSGRIERQIEAEQFIIERILPYKNIKLFSFNNRTDLTTDLNNYKDIAHYGGWVNSAMLKWMKEEKYMLTTENYKDYLAKEKAFYTSFDYASLNEQEDYESDLYAAAVFDGAKAHSLLTDKKALNLSRASLNEDAENGEMSIVCKGRLERDPQSDTILPDYLLKKEYVGAKISVPQAEKYRYLVFDGKKNADHGQITVYVYNDRNETVMELSKGYTEMDEAYHQYVMDLSSVTGNITILLNGGSVDQAGSTDSSYTFRNVRLY